MAVLDRSELRASPLADLHAIADQLGLEGFRRMRKDDLIDAILGEPAGSAGKDADEGESEEVDVSAEQGLGSRESAVPARARRSRFRTRRSRRTETERDAGSDGQPEQGDESQPQPGPEPESEPGAESESERKPRRAQPAGKESQVQGVVELLGNGSACLRVNPPESSEQDVYISAAQVRRCELVSGDRVSGPVRTPRRSERYPSLVRIETINDAPAGEVSDAVRYEDRSVTYPCERIALGSEDPVLHAIEWLTPFGRGSRVLIVGPARTGKTDILRRLAGVLAKTGIPAGSGCLPASAETGIPADREGLELTLVLSGVRPEEIPEWSEGPLAPVSALSFAASVDSQDQAVARAIETAKRTAARGGDAVVLIDSLDGLHPHAARRAMAAARNLADEGGGSLTILATATHPLGGETTVIALDPALAALGEGVPLNMLASGTVRAELLVGEEGASAIARARAAAVETAHSR